MAEIFGISWNFGEIMQDFRKLRYDNSTFIDGICFRVNAILSEGNV